jgi:thiamine-phosphate diphosphorylase
MAASETAPVTRSDRAARLHGIYLIVNEGEPDPLEIARAALSAGVRIVQYRAKRGVDERRLRDLRALTRERNALLLVNDDLQAAKQFECDGLHLGPDDEGFADVTAARAALRDRLIGLSCGTPEQARAADLQDVDYIGVGAVHATGSKNDAGAPIGIDGLQRVARASRRLPVAAIGGITTANLAAIARTGVAMAAVISAIARDPDPGVAASRLVRIWNDTSPNGPATS